MASLGVDLSGQKTPPNSPATPFDSGSSEAIAIPDEMSGCGGGGRGGSEHETSPIAVVNAIGSGDASWYEQHQLQLQEQAANLDLIRQQMITNEFTRVTGYPQDQAVRILAHFKWDYQAAVSDFFDEVKVIKQSGNQAASAGFPPHNTPLTPPAFPPDMTLSFNHLLTDSPNSLSSHNSSMYNQQQQLSLNSSMDKSNHHYNVSTPPPHNNNNSCCDQYASASLSPLAGASSPIQYQRTISGSSFHSSTIPFPMEIGGASAIGPGAGGGGLNSSTCSTPGSTGSFPSTGMHHNQGGNSLFTHGNAPALIIGNQMEYRCDGVKASDSLESME